MFLVTRKAGGKTWFLALGREYPYWTPMIEAAIQFQGVAEANVYIEEHIGSVMLHKKDEDDSVEICETQLIPMMKIKITEQGVFIKENNNMIKYEPKNVVLHFKCVKCSNTITKTLDDYFPKTFLCEKCSKMENFMNLEYVSIKK